MKNSKSILYIFLIFALSITLISCKSKNVQTLKETKNNSTTEVNKNDTSKNNTDTQPLPKAIKEIQGLVEVKDIDNSIVIDLKYAATDNFTGKKVYPVNVCLLQKETAIKLSKANEEIKKVAIKLKFDDFSNKAYRNNSNMDAEAKKNMDLLASVMKQNGFVTIR
jgi:D-alanyl-D-alanine dipeptidase